MVFKLENMQKLRGAIHNICNYKKELDEGKKKLNGLRKWAS